MSIHRLQATRPRQAQAAEWYFDLRVPFLAHVGEAQQRVVLDELRVEHGKDLVEHALQLVARERLSQHVVQGAGLLEDVLYIDGGRARLLRPRHLLGQSAAMRLEALAHDGRELVKDLLAVLNVVLSSVDVIARLDIIEERERTNGDTVRTWSTLSKSLSSTRFSGAKYGARHSFKCGMTSIINETVCAARAVEWKPTR